jgi:hypothetical protein
MEQEAGTSPVFSRLEDLVAASQQSKLAKRESALDRQVAGEHYKNLPIQPVEFIHANNIPFCEATAIKYLVRWRSKNGIEDLEKAKHYIDLLIQMENRKVSAPR